MLKILIITTVLGLALCGCSKKDDTGLDQGRSSADKATDSAKDAASNASDAAKDAAQDAARSVKETTRDVKDEAASAGERTKENTRKAMKNLADKSKDTSSAAADKWHDFRALVKKCHALTGESQKHCMAEARDLYLASDFRCQTLGSDKMRCLSYREQWKSAKADPPKAAVTHTEEPTISPASPGDPSAAQRNRDSTKQQQDAAGTLTEPKRQN
jgi:gas vesicle protein